MKRVFGLALALIFATSPVADAKDTQWLHIAVDGDHDERVRVNVPMSLVQTVLPLIDDADFSHGSLRIDDADLSHEDIVEILRAVRDAEDGEYVTIEGRHEEVRVAKEGDHILVQVVEDGWDGGDVVDIKLPVQVLDALVSDDSDELNILAAIEALGKYGEGDLITVNDNDAIVRIWIDDQNVSEGVE